MSARGLDARGLFLEQVEMRVLSGGGEDVVALPRNSVIAQGNDFYVLLQDEADSTKFMRAPVTLGDSDGRYVDALTGIFPGDSVVVEDAPIRRNSTPICDYRFECAERSRSNRRPDPRPFVR